MRKHIILGLILGICTLIIVGCSDNKTPDTFIRPMSLSTSEQKIVDLIKMNDEILLLDYEKQPEVGQISIEALCYSDGLLIKTLPIFSMGSNASERGNFVLIFNKKDALEVSIKETSGQGFMNTSANVALDFIDGEITAWSQDFLENTIDLESNNAPIIGYYIFSESGAIRASSIQNFEENPDMIKEYENLVLLRMRFEE